jgi:hypothetical protein
MRLRGVVLMQNTKGEGWKERFKGINSFFTAPVGKPFTI